MDEIVKPNGVIDGCPTFRMDVDAISRDLEERWANLPPADAALLRRVADDYTEEAARHYAWSQASGVHGSDGARLTHKAARLRALADTLD